MHVWYACIIVIWEMGLPSIAQSRKHFTCVRSIGTYHDQKVITWNCALLWGFETSKVWLFNHSNTWNRTLSSMDVNCSTNKVSWRVNVLMMDSGPPLSPAGNVLSKEMSWSFQTWAFKCSLVVMPDSSEAPWNVAPKLLLFSLRVQMSNGVSFRTIEINLQVTYINTKNIYVDNCFVWEAITQNQFK